MSPLLRFALAALLCLPLTACDDDPSGTDAGPAATDAGPGGSDAGGADAGGSDAGAADAGGVDAGDGDAGGADGGGLPPGACTNAADEMVLAMIDSEAEARMCGTMCFGGESCVTMCMEELGLSNGCASCFGGAASCAAMNCALQCAGSDMMRCNDCRRMNGCIEDFEMCSGLPGE